jgi:hypothetical protein
MASYNPFSGIPIMKIDEDKPTEGRQEREKRIKKFATKYFLDSDEDDKSKHCFVIFTLNSSSNLSYNTFIQIVTMK